MPTHDQQVKYYVRSKKARERKSMKKVKYTTKDHYDRIDQYNSGISHFVLSPSLL